MLERTLGMSAVSAVLANGLIFATIGAYWLLSDFDPDLFYQSVQEDEWLEWATVWSFLIACGFFAHAALKQRKATQQLPWFVAGLSLFCFLIAMEEISWGQRLLGYRPPAYFLEHNFQQELNLHNVMDTDLRKLGMKGILLGYGVALALLGLVPMARELLSRMAIMTPPVALVPAFLLSYFVYDEYPLRFTGEIVELMLGLGFCFAAIVASTRFSDDDAAPPRPVRVIAISAGAIAILGLGNTALTQMARAGSPEAQSAAEVELAALRQDFLEAGKGRRGGVPSKCGVHKRLYTAREKYDWDFLSSGRFAGLVKRGMPEERAEFLLDPWNYPYWIRDNCDEDRVVFVYSFGPNRLRDSTRRELREDDLGEMLVGGD